MKLLNYADGHGRVTLGLVHAADRVLPLRLLFEQGADGVPDYAVDILAFVREQDAAMARIRQRLGECGDATLGEMSVGIAGLELAPSFPRPLSLRDAIGFEGHLVGSINQYLRERSALLHRLNQLSLRTRKRPLFGLPRDIREVPYHYFANLNCIVGSGARVAIPKGEQHMDYELELAAVIGRRGKDIPLAQAAQHIAGYTIFNDLSARDMQFAYMKGKIGPGKGKTFDGANVLGPLYVTADEVGDVYQLGMRAWVNGEQWTDSSMSLMTLRFERMIHVLSQDETLYPGDLIASGTTPRGAGLELGRYLKPGDVVEIEVDGLGRQAVHLQ